MVRFLAHRLSQLVLTVLIVSAVVFAIMRVLPGDVAFHILSSGSDRGVDPVALEKLRKQLGLHDPLYMQYLSWLKGIATLHPGHSLFTGRQIGPDVRRMLGVSYELAVITMLIAFALALPLGVISALWRGRWLDQLLRVTAALGLSVPTFWIATLLLLGFSRLFHWLPPLSYHSLFDNPGQNLGQLIWPALVLALHVFAILSRMVRSSMLEVLAEEYIRTARAKGLRNRVVIIRHALKNAALPVASLAGVVFANLLGAQVVVETIFAIPGIGSGLIQSVTQRDYPVVQTILLLFALNVTVVNLGLDIVYGWLNPRIRLAS